MQEKRLLPATWATFSKGGGWTVEPLRKALVALASASDAAEGAPALANMQEAVKSLRRMAATNKELTRYLEDLLRAGSALERQWKEAAQHSSVAERAKESTLPDALGKKLTPLLKKVRSGEVMQSMIGMAGRRLAVIVSRKPLGQPHAALLRKYFGTGSAIKIMRGTCIFEENAHTFVLERGVAGLAKKLKPALHEQTGLRLAVRVRGPDGGRVDGVGRSSVG